MKLQLLHCRDQDITLIRSKMDGGVDVLRSTAVMRCLYNGVGVSV
ncbi:hypothetical protein AAZX31_12G133300 [Glycine max]